MKVYVGTYAKYNNGSLFGKWLDLTDFSDADEFWEACKELHKDEDDPEFMFPDWEDIPRGMISECSLDEGIWDLLDEIDRHNLDEVAVATFIEWEGSWDLERYQESYQGKYDSWDDFVESFVDEKGMLSKMPDSLRYYFDYKAFGRDLGHDYYIEDGYVFRCI